MSKPAVLVSLLLSSSTLAACGGDGHPAAGDARFSALSSEQRDQALQLALGTGSVLPFFAMLGAEAANAQDPTCPARVDDGARTTYTANGCTNAGDGVRYDGRLVAVNAPSFADIFGSDVDAAAPMSIEAAGWSAGDDVLDGVFRQSRALPTEGQTYTAAIDYTATLDGRALAFAEDSDCVEGGTCTLDGFADTPDGSFAIGGALALAGDRPRGQLVLRGAEELRLDLDALDADGCAPYTIDGAAAGRFCSGSPTPDPDPEPELEIGGGIGCSGINDVFTLTIDALVRGGAASVSVRVIEPATGIEEEYADLPEISYDAENDLHHYALEVPESASQLARCIERDYAYAFTAITTEGAVVCRVFGAHPELFPDCR